MTIKEITSLRLQQQQISRHAFTTPEEVVGWMGAMQAQDLRGALWSIGLRMPGTTEEAVEEAIAGRKIVRTWPMRGTLHFVEAKDVRWILSLCAPRVISASQGRLRQLELDHNALARSRQILISALQGGKQLSRPCLYKKLKEGGVSPAGQRGIHILQQLSLQGTLCFASQQGKQPAFALLEEWVPPAPELKGEDALGELVTRYFRSHGPATANDFAWWSGLKKSDVKIALHLAASGLTHSRGSDGQDYWFAKHGEPAPATRKAFLLPGFDEYLLGYTDRTAALDKHLSGRVAPGNNGMFRSTLVLNGRIAGVWKQDAKKGTGIGTLETFRRLTEREKTAVESAARRFAAFRAKKSGPGRLLQLQTELPV